MRTGRSGNEDVKENNKIEENGWISTEVRVWHSACDLWTRSWNHVKGDSTIQEMKWKPTEVKSSPPECHVLKRPWTISETTSRSTETNRRLKWSDISPRAYVSGVQRSREQHFLLDFVVANSFSA